MNLFFKLVFIFINISFMLGQIVRSSVNVSSDRLSPDQKELIRDLEGHINSYINDQNWTGNNDETEIQIKITLFIETVSSNEGQNVFGGQFLINSPAQENFYDKSFRFYYQGSESLRRHSARYNPLTNNLDFYMYMVLAGEMDTFDEYLGDDFYVKAQSEVYSGKNGIFSSDWKYRQNILIDNLQPLSKKVRLSKLNIFTLISYLDSKKFLKARILAKKIIEDLEEVKKNTSNNLILKRFLDGFSKYLIDSLDPENDEIYIDKLIFLDPLRREEFKKYKKNG